MAILGEANITLTAVNDSCSVVITPSSCVIHANYDGTNPQLSNAYADIYVVRGKEKLLITASNIIIKSKSNSDINTAFITINSTTQRLKITGLPTTVISGNIELLVSFDTFSSSVHFQFSVVRESTMLDWIQDWETNKTQIGGQYVITPRIWAGYKDSENKLTGVFIGNDLKGAGLYGYVADSEVFHINSQGAKIGGWNILNGGISSPDGNLKILSEGTIASYDGNDNVIWGLYKTGDATFAKGNVQLNSDGSASFTGSITALEGKIANWNISERAIWKSHMIIDSLENYIGVGVSEITIENIEDSTYNHRSVVQSSGGVYMYYHNAASYGLSGYLPSGTMIFQIGSTNQISGWTLKGNALSSDYVQLSNVEGNAGIYLSSTNNSGAALSGLSTVIAGATGIYMKASSSNVEFAGYAESNLLFRLGGDGNVIAGWNFDESAIWIGSSSIVDNFTISSGSMVLSSDGIFGFKWNLLPNGEFNAVDVNISGRIIATEGSVGCWNISDTLLWIGNNTIGENNLTTNDSSIVLNNTGLYGYKWRLLSNGKFYASDAEIAGKVTATTGKVGDWNISSTNLWVGNGNIVDNLTIFPGSMVLNADGIFGFKWNLLSNGAFYASEVDIEGKITATEGQIGSWNIGSNSLWIGSSSIEDGLTTSSGSMVLNSNGMYGHKWHLLSSGELYATGAIIEHSSLTDVLVRGSYRNIPKTLESPLYFETGTIGNSDLIRIYGRLSRMDSGIYELPNTIDQIGRRLTLICMHGIAYVQGTFYNNHTELKLFGGEGVELLGYGSESSFISWVVLRRFPLDGIDIGFNIVASGTVVGTNSGATIQYNSVNGISLEVSRLREGYYIISPTFMSFDMESINIILTGYGDAHGNSNAGAPMKATLIFKDSDNAFHIATSDDSTVNDGAFNFIIYV